MDYLFGILFLLATSHMFVVGFPIRTLKENKKLNAADGVPSLQDVAAIEWNPATAAPITHETAKSNRHLIFGEGNRRIQLDDPDDNDIFRASKTKKSKETKRPSKKGYVKTPAYEKLIIVALFFFAIIMGGAFYLFIHIFIIEERKLHEILKNEDPKSDI